MFLFKDAQRKAKAGIWVNTEKIIVEILIDCWALPGALSIAYNTHEAYGRRWNDLARETVLIQLSKFAVSDSKT